MSRYIDSDKLCEGRVSNDPVVIAAKCEPTADVEPVRHSKFQGDHTPVIYDTRVCFSCKQRVPVDNFCIRCGAKMDEEDKE